MLVEKDFVLEVSQPNRHLLTRSQTNHDFVEAWERGHCIAAYAYADLSRSDFQSSNLIGRN